MTKPDRRFAVNFVCLGNICRSPLAKAIFIHQAKQRGVLDTLRIDSCGTGSWHVGGPADPRSIMVAEKHGVELDHVARCVCSDDFESFDLLLAMDLNNRAELLRRGAPAERVRLMRSFDPTLKGRPEHELIVPDPYTGNDDGFQRVYEMLWRACDGLHEHIATTPRPSPAG